jgi:hypothetical protein
VNLNSGFVAGVVLSWCEREADRLDLVLAGRSRGRVEVRVYPHNGSGYFFVQVRQAKRWYFMPEAGADHFVKASVEELESCLAAGGMVQVMGPKGQVCGSWTCWDDFVYEVVKGGVAGRAEG